jgi:UDP:flavonoid glycosyltransferase YjiC (YdhE family)
MARIMIWPDLYREQGHWLPCINLARSLITAEHSVQFMGIPDTLPIVSAYASPALFRTVFASIYPLGHSVENKLEPIDQRWKPHHLLPLCRNELDPIFTGPNAPQLLIGGYFTALETLIIHRKYGIPFVIITTYLRHPQDDPAMHAKTKLLYMSRALSQKIIDLATGTTGMDIDTFIAPLDEHPEIIPCPREFDFYDPDWVHRSNVHYVEPMIQRVPLDGTPAPADPTGLPADKKIIYATSGSQVQDYEFQARQMFKNLIDMMKTQGLENHHLVLAVGPKLLTQLNVEYGVDRNKDNNALPKNVSLFDWVSQLEIVALAEAVFIHGGLATIKESIWESVPIIIVPHGKDQMDNAMRIRRNGIGVVSEVSDLGPTQLRNLLTEATASAWIEQNLTKFRDIFIAREAAKPSLPIIQSALTP